MRGVTSSPVRELLALTGRPDVITFAGGLPAPELVDLEGLRAAVDRALSGDAGRRALQYGPSESDPALRALVAERMTRRGLPTGPDDLVVTTGSQQALALVATALLDPGAVVAVEEPTYLAALRAFQLAGACVVTVPGDEDAIDPAALADVIARERPTLLYLVPPFANPTGRTLTAERRTAVAELAARHGLWGVEDDPCGELRHRGEALTALAAEHLAGADLDGHLRMLCGAHGQRRDAMLAALPGATPAGTTWTDPDGGMFLWLRLPPELRGAPTDTARVLHDALARGVAFVPGAPFYTGAPDRRTLRLCFTTRSTTEVAEGVRRLGEALLV